MYKHTRQAAFSLLELIVVIVLLGILAGGAGLLITTPIQAYSDQLRRQQLVDQAEMALRQIARDVRRALPNSIRTFPVGAGWALEMVNTVDGARYRDQIGGGFTADTDILDFSAADTEFNFLGQLNLSTFSAGQRLVIYNTVPDDFYLAAFNNSNPGIVTPAATTLTLTPAADEYHVAMAPAFQFSQQSPGQRAFIVDGPISYICDPGSRNMTRYSNYGYLIGQPTSAPPLPAGSLVVTQVAACSISYQAGTAQRGGIVTIQITLNDVASGENITLLHQVHVDNVP